MWFLALPSLHLYKYEKHFPKMLRDVGMAAVPKTTQTRYMDGSVQATQRTTQVTPSLHLFFFHFWYPFPVISQQGLDTCSIQKKRCRDGVTCVVLCVACTLPSIYLVCVVFGTAAIPTSLNIFGKCFSYLFVCFFVVPKYHTGGCRSLRLKHL